MDKERLMDYFDHHYLPKRDVLNRIPLGTSLEAFWKELVNRRRSRATFLPIRSPQGGPYWFVLTDSMIIASEKVVEEALLPYHETEMAILEEAFYTSFVEGSQMTIDEAVSFMKTNDIPHDIHEQMLLNNRQGIAFIVENLYQPITEQLIRTLAGILTAEMDGGGDSYRNTDSHVIPSMGTEAYLVPCAAAIPGMMQELCAFLADMNVHPLIKASVTHAWFMAVRPFHEGNERLARMLAFMILLKSRYTFFGDISLSALIAQDGYAYYNAVSNMLHPEHGGDWTYLVEYYIVLLGKAIDEIHRQRMERETDLAKQPLVQASQIVSEPGKTVNVSTQPPPLQISSVHENNAQQVQAEEQLSLILSSDDSISLDSSPGEKDPFFRSGHEGIEKAEEALKKAGFFPLCIDDEEDIKKEPEIVVAPMGYMEARKKLEARAAKQNGLIAAYSKRLLDLMDAGIESFTRTDVTEGIAKNIKQGGNIMSHLRYAGMIVSNGIENGAAIYSWNIKQFYAPSLIAFVKNLVHSTTSSKDRRIGNMLLNCLDNGYISIHDYKQAGYEAMWPKDAKLMLQLGLITKVSQGQYKINSALCSGFDKMNDSQKIMASQLYSAFGQELFTTEMIVATLDYSSSHTHATLHAFTLMGILECMKDGISRYQFLITPDEHPECFSNVA